MVNKDTFVSNVLRVEESCECCGAIGISHFYIEEVYGHYRYGFSYLTTYGTPKEKEKVAKTLGMINTASAEDKARMIVREMDRIIKEHTNKAIGIIILEQSQDNLFREYFLARGFKLVYPDGHLNNNSGNIIYTYVIDMRLARTKIKELKKKGVLS